MAVNMLTVESHEIVEEVQIDSQQGPNTND